MANAKAPAVVLCRLCKKEKGLFATTRKEKGFIVWISVCAKCKEEERGTRLRL